MRRPGRVVGTGRLRWLSRGFTLIEIMVVLVIIAVLAGFSVLAVRGRDVQSVVDAEVTRLGALFALAQEDALFRYRTLGALLSQKEYRFFVYHDGQWVATDDALLTDRAAPAEVSYSLYLDDRPAVLEVEADTGGNADGGEGPIPQILFFADGVGTSFELVVEAEGAVPRRLKGTAVGRILVEPMTDTRR